MRCFWVSQKSLERLEVEKEGERRMQGLGERKEGCRGRGELGGVLGTGRARRGVREELGGVSGKS